MLIGEMIVAWRKDWSLGVRATAKIIGISPATLNRIENGENCDAKSLIKILAWVLGD